MGYRYVGHGLEKLKILGTIDTPMVSNMLDRGMLAMDDLLRELPMARLGRPEEIADAVLWLCSPGSTFVTGQALAVDGSRCVLRAPGRRQPGRYVRSSSRAWWRRR